MDKETQWFVVNGMADVRLTMRAGSSDIELSFNGQLELTMAPDNPLYEQLHRYMLVRWPIFGELAEQEATREGRS